MRSSKTTPSGSGGAINIVVGGINAPITLDKTNPTNSVPLPVSSLARIVAHFALDTSSTTVSTSAYTQLIAATGQYWNELELFNLSQVPFVVAFGASGSEVDQFYVGNEGLKRQAIAIPAGTRISIKALGSSINGGLILLNAFN